MMKKMMMFMVLALVGCASILGGCSGAKQKDKVVIYSNAEDYRNEYFLKRLKEEFPDYEIVLEYITTGNHAAKLKAEGTNTDCDITLDLDYAYLEMVKDNLADLSSYDSSVFVEDLKSPDHKYFPELRNSGCIIINTELLEKKGLKEPTSYEDLLDPSYKGLISMPSPKSSGTGYMFLKSLVNSWGEDEAFAYFDKLTENILQYTSSGSGPVNALAQGEVVIGLGMTAQAVTKMNDGAKFKLLFFEEGAPYAACGYAMIKGKETKEPVKQVFDFFYTTLIKENNQQFFPEAVYQDEQYVIENYPENINYSNMDNNGVEEKERLLEKWMH